LRLKVPEKIAIAGRNPPGKDKENMEKCVTENLKRLKLKEEMTLDKTEKKSEVTPAMGQRKTK